MIGVGGGGLHSTNKREMGGMIGVKGVSEQRQPPPPTATTTAGRGALTD